MLKILLALLVPCAFAANYHLVTSSIKNADESVAESTTYQADDELYGVFLTGKAYRFEVLMHILSASAVPDIKIQFAEPVVGSTITAHCFFSDAAGTQDAHMATFDQEFVISLGAGAHGALDCRGTMQVGTGGQFAVEWAQNTSNENATTVMAGSHWTAMRITE